MNRIRRLFESGGENIRLLNRGPRKRSREFIGEMKPGFVITANMDADTLIRFLKRLIKDTDRKVFLILDNLRGHHSKVVKGWLAIHNEEIELVFLPSYSPELNPDEYLNCDLKSGVHSGIPARTSSQLKGKATSHMRKLQKLPEKVRRDFRHPKIAYAT